MIRLLVAGLVIVLIAKADSDSPRLLGIFPVGGEATQTNSHDPILFIHGYTSGAGVWETMMTRFQADGWATNRLFAFTFSSSQSNATVAQAVKLGVDRIIMTTGAAKVDIVTHSMGGLSSRYYIKNLGGTNTVDDWVSLGGPNHGTRWAYGCYFFSPCNQMVPGSGFLNALNSGDETPGGVNYGTWWSPCDALVTPPRSTTLSGATNTQTSCIGHSDLRRDATVYGQVRDFVR
jgi:triacylglycerol lipase